MGEFALYGRERIKIGTCENMYYLRADQRGLVTPLGGNVNPLSERDQATIRFRFPWPDEDNTKPGAFEEFERTLGVTLQWSRPMDFEHGSVGLQCSLPCPLGPRRLEGITVHKNGWSGDVRLVQTAFRDGEWRAVCQCGGCGYAFNLPRWAAEELAAAIRAKVDRFDAPFYHKVADRVLAGYALAAEAV